MAWINGTIETLRRSAPWRPGALRRSRGSPLQRAWEGEVEDRLAAAGVVLALAALSVQTVAYLVWALLLSRGGVLFDADSDTSAPAWGGSVAIFAGALAALLRSLAAPAEARLYAALAGLLAFLSVDEIVTMHERVGVELSMALDLPIYFARTLWPVVFLPLLVLVFALLLQASNRARTSSRRLLRLGLALLTVAVAAEILSVLLASDDTRLTWAYFLEVAFEEGAELAGWILIAFGLIGHAARGLLERYAPRNPTPP